MLKLLSKDKNVSIINFIADLEDTVKNLLYNIVGTRKN